MTTKSWHGGAGLFSTSKEGEQITPGGELPAGPTCTAMSSLEELLAATQLYLCLSGHLGNPM